MSQRSNSPTTNLALQEEANLQQIHQDFYELFTSNPNKDMLKYAYQDPSLYDAVTKSPDYYLFRDEAQLIAQHKDKLSECLSGIKTVVELGPGAENGLSQKTLPLLSYAKDLRKYIAVDISQNYLEKIGRFIKSKTNLAVDLVQANFVEDSLKLIKNPEPKAFILLGSTLGGFCQEAREYFLQNLRQTMKKNDIFIMTVDSNRNKASLLKAYSGTANLRFAQEIFEYYALINKEFVTFKDKFRIVVKWDEKVRTVEKTFITTELFNFNIQGFGKVHIPLNSKFKIIRSHKFTVNQIYLDFHKSMFKIVNILEFGNMSLFIAKK